MKKPSKDQNLNLHFETRALHAGQAPEPRTGAINTPIFYSSTYVQEGPGKHKGFEYSRTHNPTRDALENCIASLEGAHYGVSFSSGLAASSTILSLLKTGDEVIISDDLYGGSHRLFQKVFTRFGLSFTMCDLTDLDHFQDLLRTHRPKLIWLETPTNPLMKIIDIKKISKAAHKVGALLVVDNTFATPVLQNPLKLGADLVVHSTTKYLNGHTDVVGGAIVTKELFLYEELKFLQNAVGSIPGPMDCYLTLRGIKTLPLRMERHEKNAQAIAKFLESHKKIEKVLYPGLKSHPQHKLAKSQMNGFGGMLTVILKGGMKETTRFLQRLSLFSLAESLGGVESLINHPARMTHAAMDPTHRKKLGITDSLVRVSVGIENLEDLISDLKQALS